ncbi:MAG: ATP synthase F1 subunit gamma [Bacteroidia bacterium]|nr:ATP synthase F1 subunit gamma [Bacteroidia bacterium]
MAGLKEIKGRIKSVKSTQKVTKAMKLVSASKLRRAQDRILQLRPYALKLREIIGNVVSVLNVEEIPSQLVEVRDVNNILVILVTSNRGLCGPFNNNIIKHTMEFLNENHQEDLANGKVKFLCLGRKGYDYIKRRGYEVIGNQNFDVLSNLNFDTVDKTTDIAVDMFLNGEVDKVYLMFNEFKNVMSQIRRADTLLPLAVEGLGEDDGEEEGLNTDYIFEPGREEILTDLIPKALRIQAYRAVLESNASEQGARMVAMDAATENAEKLLKELKITYNKARQAAITKEILEISSGADALANA